MLTLGAGKGTIGNCRFRSRALASSIAWLIVVGVATSDKKPSCLTARRVGARGRGGLDPVGKL